MSTNNIISLATLVYVHAIFYRLYVSIHVHNFDGEKPVLFVSGELNFLFVASFFSLFVYVMHPQPTIYSSVYHDCCIHSISSTVLPSFCQIQCWG